MPSTLPPGEPAPADGSLPAAARAELAARPLSLYLHVPFCTTRCGYCDFNTYTAAELGPHPGAGRDGYVEVAVAELEQARRVLGDDVPEVSTIFVGGGTPTLLPAGDLGRFVARARTLFGLTSDVEVTTESNPDSVDADGLARLADDGFTRVSFGMQSVTPHVLAVLDRHHTPGRPQQAVAEATAAGIAHTSLDLIYGTPGESLADWAASLDAAIAAGPDHLSAYALIVEDGTRLAVRIRRGELAMTDDDDLADKYLLAEQQLTAAGFDAYELSNWATGPTARCRHNLAYWRGDHWWGIGPGAHSHVGGVRWWNVKHPAAYAARIAAGVSPAHARELLSAADRVAERILLEIRLADGLDLAVVSARARRRVPNLVARGLATVVGHGEHEHLVLTLDGRLLADALVRDLVD
ncbi:MAG: radical SAM family heme chaperone HemW [Propionibacteriaceae bacterium]